MTVRSRFSLRGVLRAGAPLLALALLPLVVACGNPAKRALEGRWHGDTVENFDENEAPSATGWAKGTSFEFSGSSLTVAIPAEEPRTGTYRVSSMQDRELHLAVLDPDGEQSEMQLILDDEKSMRWLLGDGRALVMRRQ